MQRLDRVQCLISGAGPAGLMLGYLLARRGVRVRVLEKHADFLRDFRGDTIHPSTLEIMAELGLLDRFLRLPHSRVSELAVEFGQDRLLLADFRRLRVRAPFIAMMPQWDFLRFLADEALSFPNFSLVMEAEARDLMLDEGRVQGVVARTAAGVERFSADVVVGACGRGSELRALSGLSVRDLGAPIDVLWFRLPKVASDPQESTGRFDRGRVVVRIDRGDYWQIAYVIAKGALDGVKAMGLPAFRLSVAAAAPFLADRIGLIAAWDDLKLLSVKVDRLETWTRPGLLFIGDAAHAMSPIGGVGVNLAVQDAVAAANVLVPYFKDGGAPPDEALALVESRRLAPTKIVQAMQVQMQRRLIEPLLDDRGGPLRAPLLLRIIAGVPWLRGIPARLIGLGVRPEHVRWL